MVAVRLGVVPLHMPHPQGIMSMETPIFGRISPISNNGSRPSTAKSIVCDLFHSFRTSCLCVEAGITYEQSRDDFCGFSTMLGGHFNERAAKRSPAGPPGPVDYCTMRSDSP